MDLLDELADRIGFKYQLYLVNDGKYGAQEARTGTWNGMVADLVNRVSVNMVDMKLYVFERDSIANCLK